MKHFSDDESYKVDVVVVARMIIRDSIIIDIYKSVSALIYLKVN